MKRYDSKFGRIGSILLFIYVLVVIYFVFFSDRLGRNVIYASYHYNLIPFEEIRRFIMYRSSLSTGAFVLNLFGNVMVTAPFGVLVPVLREKKTGLIRIIIYTLVFSLMIETIQLVTRVGVFDVDDLILNTAGGVVGLYYYGFLRWLYIRLRRKRRNNDW